MASKLFYPVDLQLLQALKGAGWDFFKLYWSNSPSGPWQQAAGAVFTPATIQLAIDNEEDTITIDYPQGNAALWYKIVPANTGNTAPLSDSRAFHGGGGTTLAALRETIGTLTNDIVVTESTGGSASTIITADIDVIRYPDDYFNGFFMLRRSTGEVRTVSDYVQSTGTLTVSPTFSTAVTAGETVELFRRWTPDEYRWAINTAIATAYPVLSKTITRTLYYTEEDRYEYTLPADIREVTQVEIEDYEGAYGVGAEVRQGHPWRKVAFGTKVDGLQTKLEFKQQLPYASGRRRLRVTGSGQLSQLYEDSDYTEIVDPQTRLLAALAAHYLYTLLPARAASSDREFYQEMAKFYLSLYSEQRAALRSGRPPRMIWGSEPKWGGRR